MICNVTPGQTVLLVIFIVVSTFKEFALDILPQLTSVVVLVPSGNGRVEACLERKGAGENRGHVDRVSLEQSSELCVSTNTGNL